MRRSARSQWRWRRRVPDLNKRVFRRPTNRRRITYESARTTEMAFDLEFFASSEEFSAFVWRKLKEPSAASSGSRLLGTTSPGRQQQFRDPAKQGDQEPAEHGRTEIGDRQVAGQRSRYTENCCVDDKEEKPEGEDDEWQAEEPEQRPEDQVDDGKDEGHPDVPPKSSIHVNARDDLLHQANDHGQDENPESNSDQHAKTPGPSP